MDIDEKMQRPMFNLTKDAAISSYQEYLDDLDISDEEYEEIKQIWLDRLGVKPYI